MDALERLHGVAQLITRGGLGVQDEQCPVQPSGHHGRVRDGEQREVGDERDAHARRDEALAMCEDRFCRMWEFYLAVSEVAFRELGHMVFQLQLTKKQTAAPLSRDYLCG